jgi:hypothetical protein
MLIHLSDGSDTKDDWKGNNFARSINAGLSSVSIFKYVSLLGS